MKATRQVNRAMLTSRSFGAARSVGRLQRGASRGMRTMAARTNYRSIVMAGAVSATALMALSQNSQSKAGEQAEVDFDALRKDIVALMATADGYDDGSYGPVFIRLAWHAAGSYDKHSKTGGSTGASMRWRPEAAHGGNAGLHVARNLLEGLKKKYPGISYADLWSLAGTVAIEELGGPKAKWRPGRVDYPSEADHTPTPDGRLPDAAQGADHLRDVFYRMGFNDREIVALSGAHVLGRCHKDRSGFDGPWTNNPVFFSNDYFLLLRDETWTERNWNGPRQFEDSSKKLMMLPSDMALMDDPAFSHWVNVYADDEELFFKDFAAAWTKLQEVGVAFPNQSVWEKLFG